MQSEDRAYMEEAIELAFEGMRKGAGGPFGAVVVRDGRIVGRGYNQVIARNDPTAHAEIIAIRQACRELGDFQLTGCTLYSSCEPCPMCLGAIYWARPERLVFACKREDAAAIEFDDQMIYKELKKPIDQRIIVTDQCMRQEALKAFREWDAMENKPKY